MEKEKEIERLKGTKGEIEKEKDGEREGERGPKRDRKREKIEK